MTEWIKVPKRKLSSGEIQHNKEISAMYQRKLDKAGVKDIGHHLIRRNTGPKY